VAADTDNDDGVVAAGGGGGGQARTDSLIASFKLENSFLLFCFETTVTK